MLFYEEFMSDMFEKHCYNREYSNIFLKYVQISIDNCPFTKYTYSTLKHICQIGFKTHNLGGITLSYDLEYVSLLLSVGLCRPLGGLK